MALKIGCRRFCYAIYLHSHVISKATVKRQPILCLGRHFSHQRQRSLATKMANCSVLDFFDLKSTPEEMRATADKIMQECRKSYDAIANVPDEDVNFETILKALNEVERKLLDGYWSIKVIPSIAPDPEIRKASSEINNKYQGFIEEMNSRPDIFHKIQVLESKNLPLTGESKYYLQKLLESGKRCGFHLPNHVQEEIKKLKQTIIEKCSTFQNNLSDNNTIIEFNEEELDGVPQDLIDSLEKSADSGKRKLTMKYPHYIPVMQMCRNPETRKAMVTAFDSQCLKENTALLEEVATLRHKVALLLGYSNHADLIATQCQAKSEKTVKKFLDDMYAKVAEGWKEEKKQLLELKERECKELNIPFDGKLNYWDMSYYLNKFKELKCNVDQKKLQEYFPLDVVTKGMFQIYQKLLGLLFTEVKGAKVWHPDVKLFRVNNSSDGQVLGYFFLDLFPREGKYEHAAIEGVQNNCIAADGKRQPNIVVMMCNFSTPTANKPSLLTHREVETYFHEFGHVMHNMCAQNEYARFHPHDIQSDFVEVPSQILENWVWEKEPLKLMSAHYLTGDPLPDDMINNLMKSRLLNVAYFYIRQLIFGRFDQEIHSQEKSDTSAINRRLGNDMLGIPPPEGTNHAAHFRHLCDQYDARYFGYLWSEVASCDLFETKFKGNDLLDPEIGMSYRKEVLEPSGAKDPCDILRSYLGRDVSQDAFLRCNGLKT